MIRNVNRIDHVAGLVRRANLAPTMERMSVLFDTRFHGPYERPAMKALVAMSLDSGIELLTPADDDPDSPLNKLLAAKGEHWMSVVMGVRDMDATCDHLARLGYTPIMRKSALGGSDAYPERLTRLEQARPRPVRRTVAVVLPQRGSGRRSGGLMSLPNPRLTSLHRTT